MSSLLVQVTSKPQLFPAGTVAGGIQIGVVGSAGSPVITPQVVASAPYSASFPNVTPDTYTITAQAIDGSGNCLGAAVSVVQVISASAQAEVSIDIPSAISAQAQ
jgi:hypothetical protein